jgi:hypothetical protein
VARCASRKWDMDLEEQKLRQHIETRETALKEKIHALKQRIEHFKRLLDVKSKAQERPGLALMGSIATGYLAKKLIGGKKRSRRYVGREDPRAVYTAGSVKASLRNPASAIISAIAVRATVEIIKEIARNLLPRKQRSWQSEGNTRNK